MDIRLSLKNPIKDSNNNIVTIEVVIEAYYQNGTKVYDESFMWNSPFDKRIPFDKFPPATLSQRKGKSEEELTKIILKLIDDFAFKNGILSCNFLYVDQSWKKYAESLGYSAWTNRQSQWSSIGETTFEDYLKRFNSNQRRNIKRERASIEKSNLHKRGRWRC